MNADTLAQLLRLFLGITEEEANSIAGATTEAGSVQVLVDEMQALVEEMKKPIKIDADEAGKAMDEILRRLEDDDEGTGNLVPIE